MRDCKTYFSYEHHQSNDLGFTKSEVDMCWHAVLLSDCVRCTCMLTSMAVGGAFCDGGALVLGLYLGQFGPDPGWVGPAVSAVSGASSRLGAHSLAMEWLRCWTRPR
jgi:hypothetical protein